MNIVNKLKRFALRNLNTRTIDLLRSCRNFLIRSPIVVKMYRNVFGINEIEKLQKEKKEKFQITDFFDESVPYATWQELINAIEDERTKYVSFDVFDTVLARKVGRPEDIHHILGIINKEPDYASARIDAELKARKLCASEEIKYEDIKKYISKKYNHILEQEEKVEEKYIFATKLGRKLIEICRRKNKRVILISDMYLSKSSINKLLFTAGVEGYDRLYVSSEYGLTKGTGTLFKKVLMDLNINADALVHIGDNSYSDYKKPLNIGIRAYRIKTPLRKLAENLKYSWLVAAYYKILSIPISQIVGITVSFNEEAENREDNVYIRMGSMLAAPLALSYVNFIHDQVVENKADGLLFAARDGYTLKFLYDRIYNDVPTYYLYASRALYINTTGEYLKKPERLRSFLKSANSLFPNITFGNTYKENVEIAKCHEFELRQFVSQNKKNFNEYLKRKDIRGSRLLSVDMTSLTFSAHKLFAEFLNTDIRGALYSVIPGSKPSFNYKEFARQDFPKELYPVITLSEFLISAPEPTVKLLNSDGSPIIVKNNQIYYLDILKGIERFERAFENLYNSSCLFQDFAEWSEFAEYYYRYASEMDLKDLQNVIFSDLSEKDGQNTFASFILRWRINNI